MTIILNGTTGVTFPNGVTMSDGTSAPVTVAQGGTGQITRQAAMDALAGAVTSGRYLRGDGTDVIMDTLKAADMTGTVAIANGGTGSTSTTYCGLTTNVTGTLPVANGGTGAATLTANNVLLGNGTSALQAVAPGSSGNILTSNGTTWQSTAPAGGGVTSLNGQTGAITNTSYQAIGSYAIVGACNTGALAVSVNSTYSGSSLVTGNVNLVANFCSDWNGSAGALTGTWRMMGGAGAHADGVSRSGGALFVRIS
jgi:hypothetical protein